MEKQKRSGVSINSMAMPTRFSQDCSNLLRNKGTMQKPQFWYSLDNGFSVGTEIDVYHHGGTVVTPSAAIKFGF